MTVDRLRAAVEAIVESLFPQRYLLTWRYTVVAAAPGPPWSLTCKPFSPLVPPLPSVPVYFDVSGSAAVPAVGSVVRIGFLEGNGSLPYVAGLGTTAVVQTYLGGAPGAGVARLGDHVTVPAMSVTVPPGGGTVPVTPGGAGPTITATIATASTKVQST